MTAVDGGPLVVLFVTNVLNGTVAANGAVVNRGTVVRLLISDCDSQKPQLLDSTVVGSGFPERTDPAALVIGPTGLAYDNVTGVLYVADSLNNRIAAIPAALFLNYPLNLGLTVSRRRGASSMTRSAWRSRPIITSWPRTEMMETSCEVNPLTYKQVAVKACRQHGRPTPGRRCIIWSDCRRTMASTSWTTASNTLDLLH